MPELDRKALKEALDNLPPRPWTVWTSCSFRRITGPDGKDGGVLHAYAQRGDGHPDLSMSEETLEALCRVINEVPALLAFLEEAERDTRPCECGADDQCAMARRAEAAEQRERPLREALEVARDYALPTLNELIESDCHPEIVATAEAHKAQVLAALSEEA